MTNAKITSSNDDTETPIFVPKKQVHPLICSRTGITVGAISVDKIAGHVPFLSQWKQTQVLHPLFSLEPVPLVNFGRSIWDHFCSLSTEEAANQQLSDRQELLLRVATLAMLHHLTDVTQTTVWLPSLADVSNNWKSILQLSYWKNYLESQRFRFPSLRISRFNNGIDLSAYIQDCWQVKKDYEKRVREAVEREKLLASEKALKVLRDDLAGKAPRSKKLLWRWFLAHIPGRYDRDTAGWMWDLFDAETVEEIDEFTMADIDLFEEIVITEVELGSSISHAFLARLAAKRELLEQKFKTFEILVPEIITAGIADGSIGLEEPRVIDYPTRVAFMIAHAKWKLAHTDMNKHRIAAEKRQDSITVKASHKPDMDRYLGRELADTEDEDTGPLMDRIHKQREIDNPETDGGETEE